MESESESESMGMGTSIRTRMRMRRRFSTADQSRSQKPILGMAFHSQTKGFFQERKTRVFPIDGYPLPLSISMQSHNSPPSFFLSRPNHPSFLHSFIRHHPTPDPLLSQSEPFHASFPQQLPRPPLRHLRNQPDQHQFQHIINKVFIHIRVPKNIQHLF